MRRFVDDQGRPWDVVVGRESWGTLVALFVPAERGAEEPVRQALLSGESHESAERELDRLDDAEMAALFSRSRPRES